MIAKKNISKIILLLILSSIFLFLLFSHFQQSNAQAKAKKKTPSPQSAIEIDETTKACIDCHEKNKIATVVNEQWKQSKHALNGIGCMACHEAQESDPDRWKHENFLITHIPSPKDCANCHEQEVNEFENSHHAKAAQFIGSLDNILGEIVEGGPAANLGCKQCHGSNVRVDTNGKPIPGTWPNTGIGRMNPDGSWGSCSACHTRHLFSRAQAREPATCGRCHMGPDHPQIEIYQESKHGIIFTALRHKMALDSDEWIVGKTYSAAPTCATCHMSATPDLPVTHDIGKRISWTLRPVVSTRLENWEARRKEMKSVCLSCHAVTWVDNYFKMYDDAVELYNRKFAIPAKEIMENLKKAGKITPTPFDDKIEWTFYELWHHEGRRARMGASMMGPDFTQWHGFYEVANHFYNKFLPEAEALLAGVTNSAMSMEEHKWKKGLTPEQLKQMLEFYEQRYHQTPQ